MASDDKMKRLTVFLPGLYGGGAERTMLNLADGFAQRGVPVDLVVGVVDGPLQTQIPDSVRYVPLYARRTLTVLPALVGYLRRERPHAMLTALNRANLMGLWARGIAGWIARLSSLDVLTTRVVISERNTLSAEARHGATLADRFYPLLGRLFYPWADGIVAVSKGVAADLTAVTALAPERITTIYNPVVSPILEERAQQPIDHPWFGEGEPPVLLGVGRLSEQKDFATLIRAFAQVAEERVKEQGKEQDIKAVDGDSLQQPSARLLILGEGPQRGALENLVNTLGINELVSLPGWVDNPVSYMREAELFVLCSRWEGLPGVLIEALFAGAPVIATDAPGGSGEVLGHGEFGHLVPVGDVDALARAIEGRLSRRRQPPSPQSWQPYMREQVLDQYAELLML